MYKSKSGYFKTEDGSYMVVDFYIDGEPFIWFHPLAIVNYDRIEKGN